MTEIELPQEPATTRRSRLQRRLRRQRVHATRDAVIGAAITALAVLLFGGTIVPAPLPATATDRTGGETGDGAAAQDDGVRFRAAMVGDLMFGRHVQRVVDQRGIDSLLEHVAPLLEGDYVSGNLEQVISDREDLPQADKLIHLRSGTETAQALADAGFTILSLANNHTMDHGIPGLRDTIEALDAVGLEYTGAGEDLDRATTINLQQHGDLTVASLSFTDVFVAGFIARAFQGGALEADPDVFVPLIQQAAAQADLVIAHFHWGEEYDFGPRAHQRELAEEAAIAGADIIVGHHPHVLMPVELLGDTLVFHSLGNFVFDQGWSRTRETAIARYALADDGTATVELIPVYLREATPRPVEGPLGAYRRERIFQRLKGDGLEWRREGDRLVATFEHRVAVGESPP